MKNSTSLPDGIVLGERQGYTLEELTGKLIRDVLFLENRSDLAAGIPRRSDRLDANLGVLG
ncbi:hypothetical protein [Laspinema palackyanum]|uniref:hypothetical protein n=1 Tax=Laspinema palackyanum TaxID=3231601 RepID=UPI00345DAEF5|nr:hypothetical protein [Laspinema sp. D2c]